jgi:hypothetical protein
LFHSGTLLHLFSTLHPSSSRPLCRAGAARHVIPLRAAANFCRDPPSPWVRFFGCRGARPHIGPPVFRKFPLQPFTYTFLDAPLRK